MTRDEVKQILGEGATEEQITNTLNALHNRTNALRQENESLKAQNSKYSDYDSIKAQLDTINKNNMTIEEQMKADREEIAKNLRESKLIKNKAKVLEVLAGRDIDDELVDSIVSEDENASIAKAQKLVAKLDSIIEDTKKQTEESIANLNVKPNMSNKDPNANNDKMTWEKFSKMSQEEQNKFANENPEEFENL
jgi:hypothetical protein